MKFDWSVISSCSKYGTFENEQSRASDRANIRELHVSTPYEFLVPVKTTHAPNPTPSLSLPPTKQKKFPFMFTWQFRWSNVPLNSASKSVKSLTHQWQCKSFPMRSNNRLFICKYSETWLSAHLQDLPKGPLMRGLIEVCENRTMFVND